MPYASRETGQHFHKIFSISSPKSSLISLISYASLLCARAGSNQPQSLILPPQLPWLLERREDPEEDRENAIIRFYCLSSGKVHTIFCPGSRRAWLRGPARQYLLASHSRTFQMHLLNPLTHDEIHIPLAKVFGDPDYIGPDQMEGGDIVVVWGGADFFRFPGMKWNTAPKMMAFLQPDADDWVYVAGIGGGSSAFYMGQYFNNDYKTGITNVIDIATKSLVYQVEPPEGTNPLLKGCTMLVESGGKILRLFKHNEAAQSHFDIYYLYFGDGEGRPCWMKITDIGDQMLFLQYHSGLSFCASNFAGFKGNCIYFLENIRYLCRYVQHRRWYN